MAFHKLNTDVFVNNSMERSENYPDIAESFDHNLRTRLSSKKSDSVFTRKGNVKRGIKDSLLLYEGQSFELGNVNAAVNVPRRHMSGAKDCFDSSIGNFEKCAGGKHVWYREDDSFTGRRMEDGARRLSATNSVHIRDVIENATHSIARSQKACLGIKGRLNKYCSSNSIHMPGSFSGIDVDAENIAPQDLGRRSEANDQLEQYHSVEPIQYLSRLLVSPVIIKAAYFLLAHWATLECDSYSFVDTCAMVINSRASWFTLSQLDNLILEVIEAWLLIKAAPILVKTPWRFYDIASRYQSCSKIHEGMYDWGDRTAVQELTRLCKRHGKLGSQLYRTSLIVLIMSPLGLTLGALAGHAITFKLTTYELTASPRWTVYWSLMSIAFSPSQFALLIWCLWCQYFKDTLEYLENYVVRQHQAFVKDIDFIADQLDKTQQTNSAHLDAGTRQMGFCESQIRPSRIFHQRRDFQNTHPIHSPHSNSQLPSFAMAAYESPLTGKKPIDSPISTIQPVSPMPGPFRTERSPGKPSFLNRVFAFSGRLPIHVLALLYRVTHRTVKVLIFSLFLSYWIVIGKSRHSS
ncbi:LADA_0H11056g1_1 [Lachancea dasiensis]|uniref:LADA_0H11056g1_1 n=1 Tax=Lachancea dasiensis TaxID=1072105 RepID=A0A1G4K3E4_9SACH|nr:LADA_0H11056g1_1 [Lachancea dasiensis]